MDPPSSIPVRASGIPRPTSRLPVLKSSSSQSQLREKSSRSSLSSVPKPAPTQPTVTKKPSRTSLARPTSSTSTATKRTVTGISQPKTATREPTFKKPIGRPPSRQTRTGPSPTPYQCSSGTNQEEDGLGALEGFRSSSRASSRVGFRDNEPEYTLQNDPEPERPLARKSRPSLSDRTIESLSQLPASPAGKSRRTSGFFNPDQSMGPPSRPASALGNNRRPTTSDGTPKPTPATPARIGAGSKIGALTGPGKRASNVALPTRVVSTPSKPSVVPAPGSLTKRPLATMHNVQASVSPRPLSNSKTLHMGRTPKSRPSLAGAFGEAAIPPASGIPLTPSPVRQSPVANGSSISNRKVSASSAALRQQISNAKAARKSNTTVESVEVPAESEKKAPNSSLSLREQIAKAKEAARRANKPTTAASKPIAAVTENEFGIVPDPAEIASFDFGLDDPFNQRPKGSKSLLRKRIDSARTDGRLNIAAMGLSEFPDEVANMYKYDPDDNTISWGEIVDLTTMIAADNELATLPDLLFPDVDIDSALDDDDLSPQFGGVQSLDLHGNVLQTIPIGFRRLAHLAKLNLANNQLDNSVLDVISQITSLRELKLSKNQLSGTLSPAMGSLAKLEVLELQGNQLTSLPDEVQDLVKLRALNISDNQIKVLPPKLFTSIPLVELNATKNRLSGSLFTVTSAPNLQTLLLSNNAITSLSSNETVELPSLVTIDISVNRLSSLPNISSWENLITLLVGENKLTSLPEGFSSLPKLRNADFTSNDITKLDDRIALMDNLDNFTIAANPLRERKFLTMNTEDIKRELLSRIEPTSDTLADIDPAELERPATAFKVQPSGTLDLSSKDLTCLDDEEIKSIAESNDIRQLYLHQNALTSIPPILSLLTNLTVLDLSKNRLARDVLTVPIHLPRLQELRLANNNIQSFQELTMYLTAPRLQRLDLTNNRISGRLPILRNLFPELAFLMASDNSIEEVDAEALDGMKVVNLSNNELMRLDPRIGLLAGSLVGFEAEGNRFRVPGYAVLSKGTDAILAWLRGKIPGHEEEEF